MGTVNNLGRLGMFVIVLVYVYTLKTGMYLKPACLLSSGYVYMGRYMTLESWACLLKYITVGSWACLISSKYIYMDIDITFFFSILCGSMQIFCLDGTKDLFSFSFSFCAGMLPADSKKKERL
jgi:uncharacterized membrane protein